MSLTDPHRNVRQVPVSSSKLYPPIVVEGPNLNYAYTLSLDMVNIKSEFTTINQYIYENWMLSKEYPKIADTIMRIAMVEIHHFHMLGELIVLLGGNPKYEVIKQNRRSVWNGNMVHTNLNPEQFLMENLKDEEFATESYLAQAKKIGDKNVSAVLNRIAEDEQIHIQLFQTMLQSLQKKA